jgi:hypothetical protein
MAPSFLNEKGHRGERCPFWYATNVVEDVKLPTEAIDLKRNFLSVWPDCF